MYRRVGIDHVLIRMSVGRYVHVYVYILIYSKESGWSADFNR